MHITKPKESWSMVRHYRDMYRMHYGIYLTVEQAIQEDVNLCSAQYIFSKYRHQQVQIQEEKTPEGSGIINNELLERYQALYRSHFGVNISREQAQEQGVAMAELLKTILKFKARTLFEENKN